jgi:hypothetical protein
MNMIIVRHAPMLASNVQKNVRKSPNGVNKQKIKG